MKKQFLALASAVVLLAACHNAGSSTIGEKDEDYANAIHHPESDADHNNHSAPATRPLPADRTKTKDAVDTLHQKTAADTTHGAGH